MGVGGHLTSYASSRCEYVNKDPRGAGQENTSRNIWKTSLRMWGHGFPPKGAKPYDKPPMNLEGDEAVKLKNQVWILYKSILSSKPYRFSAHIPCI